MHAQVRDHQQFTRQGPDVHTTIGIPLTTAILGGSVTVPTLKGVEEVKVEAGTQHSDTKVLTGRGIKRLSSESVGNQYVHFDVQIPR